MHQPAVVRLFSAQTVVIARHRGLKAPARIAETIAASDFATRGIPIVFLWIPFRRWTLCRRYPALVLEDVHRALELVGTDGQGFVRAKVANLEIISIEACEAIAVVWSDNAIPGWSI